MSKTKFVVYFFACVIILVFLGVVTYGAITPEIAKRINYIRLSNWIHSNTYDSLLIKHTCPTKDNGKAVYSERLDYKNTQIFGREIKSELVGGADYFGETNTDKLTDTYDANQDCLYTSSEIVPYMARVPAPVPVPSNGI